MLNEMKKIKIRITKKENISEEDVRQALNADIKNYIKNKYKLDIMFSNEVKTESKTFIDSKYGNFIIEYKKPSVSIGDIQRNQLIDYLKLKGHDSWGILTNGKLLEIYEFSDQFNGFKCNSKYSGKFNEEQFKYICSVIAKKDKKILSINNINDYLGCEANKEIIKEIYSYLVKSKSKKTNLFFKEWQKLFNLSAEKDKYNEDKESDINVSKFYSELLDEKINDKEKQYKALFSIQTYYAIVLKIILYNIIIDKTSENKSKPEHLKDFFVKIENNQFYRDHNILNLIDGDFFSWYKDEFSDSLFLKLYSILEEFDMIETEGINMLFIKYYENIFPFWVRHSMGEYYTPFYLADAIVEKSINSIDIDRQYNISLLDPTCGSGIFLLSAINRGIRKIYGIDINPLAILTSKINYLINNFDIETPLEIPIYLGDSTYFPQKLTINNINCYKYELNTSLDGKYKTIDFVFAEKILNEKHFFEILDEIEIQIKLLDKKKAIDIIKSYNEGFCYDKLSVYYDKLIETIIELEKMNLNSIWLKIIGNYLKSASLKNIDCIVGNPPWVRWSNLPSEYKESIKQNCRIEGIFSDDTNCGGVDLNICVLIAFISIRERLNKNGILGFIMPDSVLFNKSFEGFRKMTFDNGKRFYLNNVVRWNNSNERPFNPVTLDFCEYYFSYKKPDNIKIYDRKDKKFKIGFQNLKSFNNHISVITTSEKGEIEKVLGHNDYVFRSGISLIKGGYYLLKFHKKIDKNISEFHYYQKDGKKVYPSDELIKLETEIVYPFIKTDNINDSEITETEYYCIYPYPYGSKEPYSLEYIRKHFPCFYNFFSSKKIQNAINTASSYNKRIQKSKFDVGIFRVGDYTYSDWFLATRDNTKSVFSIVGKIKTDWGKVKMPLFDGHINFVSRDINNKPITKNEVKKLFKSFIKRGVKLYIKNSSDARSISGRLYNDIKIFK